MGYFSFLGRHLGAAVVGGAGVILLAIGYAQAADAIVTAFPPWALQATGATLFIIAVVKVLYDFDQTHLTRAPVSTASHALQALDERPTPNPHIIPIQPPSGTNRIFVGANLSPQKLMAMFEGKTTHHGQRAVQTYLGKWIRVSGIVEDYAQYQSDFAIVRLKTVKPLMFSSVQLQFKSEFERLEMLQGGERITADGKIVEIDEYTFKAAECEIVSIEPPEAA